MIDTAKMDDLARLYRLYIMVPDGLPSLRRALKASIAHRGKEINTVSTVTDIADATIDIVGDDDDGGAKGKGKVRTTGGAQTLALALKWVQDVLDLKDKFDQVWKRSFQSDRDLESALNEVFLNFDCLNSTDEIMVSGFQLIHQPQREISRVHISFH